MAGEERMGVENGLPRIRAAVRRAEWRMRAGRVLAALPLTTIVTLALAAVAIACRKIAPVYVSERAVLVTLVALVAATLLALLVTMLRTLPPHAGALALDRHHRLDGRLATAIEFTGSGLAKESPLAAAAVEDACDRATSLSPKGAVRIAFPPELLLSALMALLVLGLALLEVPTFREIPARPAVAKLNALEMSPDDVELFKDAIAQLAERDQSPEVKAAVERFNQLIEDIAKRRLDREEAFRRMQEIEDDLLKGTEAEKMALQDAMKEMSKELDNAELTKPLAQSFKKNDLKQAQEDLNKLAEKLRDKKNKPDKSELERLRKALTRASEQQKQALDALNERRAELEEKLLKHKQEKQPDAGPRDEEQEEKLFKKEKRELERLQREIERRERAMRQLSKLDRDLAKAAEDLLRDLGMSADDLEQAAEDLNRMEQEQMSEKDKEELRQRLEELRQLIRQQGGKQRLQRLSRFGKRARGGKGGKGQGQPGQGEDGEGQEMQPGDGQGEGEGEGEGEGQGIGLRKGSGPGSIPIPGSGSGQGEGEGQGQGEGEGQGQGQGEGEGQGAGKGDGIGKGSGGPLEGSETDPNMGTVDVRAEGLDTKQGPTNAEVILSAADRGFTGKPYKNVYKKYQTVAEDQIDNEKIPDGFRFYVRRYFQLIRPRE